LRERERETERDRERERESIEMITRKDKTNKGSTKVGGS